MTTRRHARALVCAALALLCLGACGGGRAVPVEPEYDWPDAAAAVPTPADAGPR